MMWYFIRLLVGLIIMLLKFWLTQSFELPSEDFFHGVKAMEKDDSSEGGSGLNQPKEKNWKDIWSSSTTSGFTSPSDIQESTTTENPHSSSSNPESSISQPYDPHTAKFTTLEMTPQSSNASLSGASTPPSPDLSDNEPKEEKMSAHSDDPWTHNFWSSETTSSTTWNPGGEKSETQPFPQSSVPSQTSAYSPQNVKFYMMTMTPETSELDHFPKDVPSPSEEPHNEPATIHHLPKEDLPTFENHLTPKKAASASYVPEELNWLMDAWESPGGNTYMGTINEEGTKEICAVLMDPPSPASDNTSLFSEFNIGMEIPTYENGRPAEDPNALDPSLATWKSLVAEKEGDHLWWLKDVPDSEGMDWLLKSGNVVNDSDSDMFNSPGRYAPEYHSSDDSSSPSLPSNLTSEYSESSATISNPSSYHTESNSNSSSATLNTSSDYPNSNNNSQSNTPNSSPSDNKQNHP